MAVRGVRELGVAALVLAGVLALIAVSPPLAAARSARTLANTTKLSAMVAGAHRIYAAGTTRICGGSVKHRTCRQPRPIVIALRADGRRAHGFGENGVVRLSRREGVIVVAGFAKGAKGSVVAATDAGGERGQVTMLDRHGDPVQAFGSRGTASVPDGFLVSDGAHPIAIDGGGGVLLAGKSAAVSRAAVARLLPTGAPDPSFGAGGVVTVDSPAGPYRYLKSIALTSDGGIRLAGAQSEDGWFTPMAVGLTADGAADPTFGQDGIAVLQAAPSGDGGSTLDTAIAVDKQDRVIGIGGTVDYFSHGFSCTNHFVTRLNKSGNLDTAFADDGYLKALVPFTGDCVSASDLAVDARDRELLPINFNYPEQASTPAVIRLTPAGGIDTRFGGEDGLRTFHIRGNRADAVAVTTDPHGHVLAAGMAFADKCNRGGHKKAKPCEAAAIVRFKRNGKKDRSFGRGATATLPGVRRP